MKATIYHGSVHLSDAELIDAREACPICLARGERTFVFEIQDDPKVTLLECPHCSGCSASHMPRPEVLARLYETYYQNEPRRTTTAHVSRLASHIERRLQLPAGNETARIIDFGGGDGSLAIELAEQLIRHGRVGAADITLVDFHDPPSPRDPRITVKRESDLASVQPGAHVVLASAIMEHLPDCNAMFRRLFGLLRPGGYYYARTPWTVPLKRLLKKVDMTYPFHVHDMGGGFWNRIRETFGLNGEVVISGPSPIESALLEYPLRTVAAMVLKAPARVERIVGTGKRKDPIWTLVGGWELLYREAQHRVR